MNNRPSSSAKDDGISQLRGSIPFPPDKSETWLLVGDEWKSATIVDESHGGMGLTMELADAANLQVGDLLTVLCCGFANLGEVRWTRHIEETQKVCLGIRWTA